MKCQIKLDLQNVTYIWYKNGRKLDTQQILNIKNFRERDYGMYKCIVTGKTDNGYEMQLETTSYQREPESTVINQIKNSNKCF